MSRVALATLRFEEVCRFYGEALGFPALEEWDRPGARGRIFDLSGLRLEVLDASRERPMALGDPRDRIHLVVELPGLDAVRARLGTSAPAPRVASWGARLLELRDPDGVAVVLLEKKRAARSEGGPRSDA